MGEIQKVAVIGSGVMGAAIAAHIANSHTPVILLDIVPEGAKDRSVLAKTAIQKLLKADPAPLTHKRQVKWMTPGNLEDDLHLLKDVDWIIEAVLEDVDIKHRLYQKLLPVRKSKAILSSNTSTIPHATLIEGLPKDVAKYFMVTHFFNPPRYMQLLEWVTHPQAPNDVMHDLEQFMDVRLGKGVVKCKDTPGFIANRIGCFWMTVAVQDAIAMDITVEEADAVLGRPVGVPKTGVFGLLDLIGIDLMPLIVKAFQRTLPADDWFLRIYEEPTLIRDMIDGGYTGRKGKGGFYRLNEESGKKVKEVRNLQTGKYEEARRPKVASTELAKKGWRLMLEAPDRPAQYASSVMLKVLAYTLSLVPEISDTIMAVDQAMRLGYNWKYGPFELIDRLGDDVLTGTAWLTQALEARKIPVPPLLRQSAGKPFYRVEEDKKLYFTTQSEYRAVPMNPDAWTLADKKRGQKPVAKNPSASLWDIGDGILCLEYTSKMNSVDPFILEMITKSVEIVKKSYTGLVVANDGENFCVGANIGVLLFAANVAAWGPIRDIIKQGQDAYMGLKYAPFPVVCAPSGMALGGGCEILLHADAVQAHVETYTGLVEVGVGIIPGWGGCKEMLLRHLEADTAGRWSLAKKGGMFALSLKQAVSGEGTASLRHPIATMNAMPAVSKAFEYIATARVAKSAEEARDMLILRPGDRITMNRKRLLPDAKATCLELSRQYTPPKPATLTLPGKSAYVALKMAIASFVKSGKATPHDEIVSMALAGVLSGGDTDVTRVVTEQHLLDLEREAFMNLIRTDGTLARIEHMLASGKPLRN